MQIFKSYECSNVSSGMKPCWLARLRYCVVMYTIITMIHTFWLAWRLQVNAKLTRFDPRVRVLQHYLFCVMHYRLLPQLHELVGAFLFWRTKFSWRVQIHQTNYNTWKKATFTSSKSYLVISATGFNGSFNRASCCNRSLTSITSAWLSNSKPIEWYCDLPDGSA